MRSKWQVSRPEYRCLSKASETILSFRSSYSNRVNGILFISVSLTTFSILLSNIISMSHSENALVRLEDIPGILSKEQCIHCRREYRTKRLRQNIITKWTNSSKVLNSFVVYVDMERRIR